MSDVQVSISLQRRRIALAIFSDLQLMRMEVRHLSSDAAQASTTVHRLIDDVLEVTTVQRAALEVLPEASTRRGDLARLVQSIFGDRGIPVIIFNSADVRRAFNIPPGRTRKTLQRLVANWWPALLPRFRTPTVLDAAALGLYSQLRSYLDH